MSLCRWCLGGRKHKEDCPNKEDSFETVARKRLTHSSSKAGGHQETGNDCTQQSGGNLNMEIK